MLTYLLSRAHARQDAKKTKTTSSMLYSHNTRSRSVFSRDGANEELIVPALSMPLSMAMVKNEHRYIYIWIEMMCDGALTHAQPLFFVGQARLAPGANRDEDHRAQLVGVDHPMELIKG